MIKVYNNKLILKFILIFYLLIFSNIQEAFSCEKWVKDFAKKYCSQTKQIWNPIKRYDELKSLYNKEINIKKSSLKKTDIDTILINNIREQCSNKKQYILRIFR